MTSLLPPIPRLVFTILEPLSLVAGFLVPFIDNPNFVNAQIPSVSLSTPITPTNRVLSLQLANVYGLVGMIGLGVLYQTSEPKVVRNYLIACAIGDVGHLWVTCDGMGINSFMDVRQWNSLAWGNIGVTFLLLVTRVLYLGGFLGNDRVMAHRQGNRQKVK